MSDVYEVLEVIRAADSTAHDIAKATGVPVRAVASYASRLASMGLIERKGKTRTMGHRSRVIWTAIGQKAVEAAATGDKRTQQLEGWRRACERVSDLSAMCMEMVR